MQLSPEQQKAIDAQKEQCPFCKIVKGEIQSKKVYEDDKILAILDINPAAKGHLLVLPKEHYPIMPLMPPETFEHLFAKTKAISNALKEAMLTFSDTIYIANGYAAGQQSSHFMLHIIPREDVDGLEFFTLKKGNVGKDDSASMLKQVLPAMLKQRSAKFPIVQPQLSQTQPVQQVTPQPQPMQKTEQQQQIPTASKEYIFKLIESNQQLKDFITQYPDQFRKQVNDSPRLKKLFEHVDIEEVIAQFAPKKSKYSMDELVNVINDNPKLKELLLKQTFLFTEKVNQIPELKEIFEGVDVEELERAVMIKDIKEEQDVKDIMGSFAEKIPKKEEPKEKEEEEPALQEEQEDVHLEIPESDNPALIQEEDESAKRVDNTEEKPNLDLISRLYGEFSKKK
jgi:histidine triad (HIT) family protein